MAVDLAPYGVRVNGLIPGSITGTLGYRAEMVGGAKDLKRIVPAAFIGGLIGALLVLVLDPAWFRSVVPVLIGFGILLGPHVLGWIEITQGVNAGDLVVLADNTAALPTNSNGRRTTTTTTRATASASAAPGGGAAPDGGGQPSAAPSAAPSR